MIWRKVTLKQRYYLILGLIVLAAFILRIWGTGYGLPYTYHVDEHYYINTALKLGTGVIHNPPYAPTGLSNLLFAEYASYFLLGKLFGLFASVREFESAFRNAPSTFYLLARVTSALLGALTCLPLYKLGSSALNPTAGLVAAGFLAVSFLHVRDSHYAVPDAAVTFFLTLSVALSTVGVLSHKPRYIYLASLAGGLAVAMKWTALPIVSVVGWAILVVHTETDKGIVGRLLNRKVIWVILLFAMGFAVGSPQILFRPSLYINEAIGLARAGKSGGFVPWQVDTVQGWLFYGRTLLIGIGPAMLAFAIAGLLRQLILIAKAPKKIRILLLVFPVTYYLVMGSTRNYFARYSLPLVPFAALFASLFAAEIVAVVTPWATTSSRRTMGGSLSFMLIIGAISQPLVNSIRHDVLLTHTDTRTLAKYWIETYIAADSKIAVDWPTFGPPLSTLDAPTPYSQQTYTVTVVGHVGLSSHPLAWYREEGFDYLITSSFISDLRLVYEEWDVERRTYYSSLDQNLRLVQEFRPDNGKNGLPFVFDEIYGPIISLWQRERPGPIIRIYALGKQSSE
jgi:hypothetical protein